MKKLTKLQVFMLMALAVGSAELYSGMNAVQMFDRVENSEDLDDEVLNELEKTDNGRAVLNQIILDESDLEAHFNKIRSFVRKLNQQIDQLMGQSEVAESEVARLAVELADAKYKLEEAQARRIAKGKNKTKAEDQINAELNKAIMALKNVNQNVTKTFGQAISAVKKQAQRAGHAMKKSNASRAVTKSFAQGKKAPRPADQIEDNAEQLDVNYVEGELLPHTMPAHARPISYHNRMNKPLFTSMNARPLFIEDGAAEDPFIEEAILVETPEDGAPIIESELEEVVTQSYYDMMDDNQAEEEATQDYYWY